MLEQLTLEESLAEGVENEFCSVVIVAGGQGTRMESRVNKVYIDLMGKTVIERTLDAFEESNMVDEIILVVNQKDIEFCSKEIINNKYNKIKGIIPGGLTRKESVSNGLGAVSEDSKFILIHDGARPLVTTDVIEQCIAEAMKYGAVSTGVKVKDTIKVVDKDGFVSNTLDRKSLWAVQTPQVFKKEIIFAAHKEANSLGIETTDDAMLVENMGYKLKMVEGSYENIKLTTPEDVIVACAIIRDREEF